MKPSSPYSISVVVPCYPPHFRFLLRSLQSIAGQTLKPLEVIVGASEISEEAAADLEKILTPLVPTRVIPSLTACNASQNRNNAIPHVRGELVTFMDADDLMHPQRLEIVDYFIRQLQVPLLVHGYVMGKVEFPFYSIETVAVIETDEILRQTFGSPPNRRLEEETGERGNTNLSVGNGFEVMHSSPTVLRSVLKEVQFPAQMRFGEDGRFCRDVLWRYHSAAYLSAKLLCYNK